MFVVHAPKAYAKVWEVLSGVINYAKVLLVQEGVALMGTGC